MGWEHDVAWARDQGRKADWRKVGAVAVGLLLLLTLLHPSSPLPPIKPSSGRLSSPSEFHSKKATSERAVSFTTAVVQHPSQGLAGRDRQFKVQAADADGAVVSILGHLEPSYVAMVEGEHERLRLRGRRIRAGDWDFDFTLYTEGLFKITVFSEGDFPFYNSNFSDWRTAEPEVFDWPPTLSRVYSFDYEVKKHGGGTLAYNRFLKQLRPCTPDDTAAPEGLQGRWLATNSIKNGEFLKAVLPETERQGRDMLFVPNRCYIPFTPTKKARQCLKNKSLAFVGDSLVEEIAVDTGMHVLGVDERPFFEAFIGTTMECGEYNQKFRMFHWPITETGTNVSMIWGGHQMTCMNSEGLRSFTEPGMNRRLRQGMLNATSIPDLPLHAKDTSRDYYLPGSVEGVRWGDAPLDVPEHMKRDVVVLDAGLHDLVQIMWKNVNLEQWVTMLDAHMRDVGSMAKKRFWHSINPKHPRANWVVREFNRRAVELAKKHDFTVLDTYSIQEMRIDSNLRWDAGDFHHASQVIYEGWRSRWLHAHTQLLLHFVCD